MDVGTAGITFFFTSLGWFLLYKLKLNRDKRESNYDKREWIDFKNKYWGKLVEAEEKLSKVMLVYIEAVKNKSTNDKATLRENFCLALNSEVIPAYIQHAEVECCANADNKEKLRILAYNIKQTLIIWRRYQQDFINMPDILNEINKTPNKINKGSISSLLLLIKGLPIKGAMRKSLLKEVKLLTKS